MARTTPLTSHFAAELLLELPFLRDWQPILHRPPAVEALFVEEAFDLDAPVVRPEVLERDPLAPVVRCPTVRAWMINTSSGPCNVQVSQTPVRSIMRPGDLALLTESIGPTPEGIKAIYRLRPLLTTVPDPERLQARARARDVVIALGLSSGGDARDPKRRELRDTLDAGLGSQAAAWDTLNRPRPAAPKPRTSPASPPPFSELDEAVEEAADAEDDTPALEPEPAAEAVETPIESSAEPAAVDDSTEAEGLDEAAVTDDLPPADESLGEEAGVTSEDPPAEESIATDPPWDEAPAAEAPAEESEAPAESEGHDEAEDSGDGNPSEGDEAEDSGDGNPFEEVINAELSAAEEVGEVDAAAQLEEEARNVLLANSSAELDPFEATGGISATLAAAEAAEAESEASESEPEPEPEPELDPEVVAAVANMRQEIDNLMDLLPTVGSKVGQPIADKLETRLRQLDQRLQEGLGLSEAERVLAAIRRDVQKHTKIARKS